MQRFAVFDIDGTIFRWQLYHELFDELYNRNLISKDEAEPIFTARNSWRDRQATFTDYELALVGVMEKSIIGVKESALIEAADAIILSKGSQIYRYTTDLLDNLRRQGYIIMAISGSQEQIVERFARLYDITIVRGKRYDIEDGVIVGGGQAVYGHKAEILQELVNEHGLDWTDSYAVGDTSSDADMMELVANPIAFNPDRALYERARKEGWKIVVERKNIAYELEANGNTFVLA
ncbi:hypothetical protein B7Y94_01615 [Candidatus Saccharibacteria bacterium 32-49-12]|nr:MAG: hypothetical protein B7Y94_01615 [Candidatus Saccharibacteria bacterium 32-49-12]